MNLSLLIHFHAYFKEGLINSRSNCMDSARFLLLIFLIISDTKNCDLIAISTNTCLLRFWGLYLASTYSGNESYISKKSSFSFIILYKALV